MMLAFVQGDRLAVLALLASATLVAAVDTAVAADIDVQHPWARATPGGAQLAAGFLTIVNHGTAPDSLTGGSFAASAGFELHVMTSENGVMKMRPAGPITVPPGATVTLDPAGTHIMFTGLKHGLKKGDTVAGTLHFEHAGTIPVTFDIEAIGAKAPPGVSGGHAMPGMNMD